MIMILAMTDNANHQETSLFPFPTQSFLQSDVWAEFRKTLGWEIHHKDGLLILERPIPFGKTFLYSPEVSSEPSLLTHLPTQIEELAEEVDAIFFRLELLIDQRSQEASQWRQALKSKGFVKAFESVQPEDRQVIDLRPGRDAVFAQMTSKGRYNIRLAYKTGVRVRRSTPESLPQDVAIFYNLLSTTSERQKFAIRPQSYFLSLAQLLYHHNYGRLFVAEYNNQPLAATIITLYHRYASYLYGASTQQDAKVMAPYAMHWEVIQWAIEQGAEWYDLLAIRPASYPEEKSHEYDGITKFKERFGGQSCHLLGAWDLPLQPLWYNLFKIAEKVRRR